MVTHMVLFKFADETTALAAQERLLKMKGRVASLLDLEVGLDFTRSARSFDLGLITRHKTREELASYQSDPVHQEVVLWMKERVTGSAAVDFEQES